MFQGSDRDLVAGFLHEITIPTFVINAERQAVVWNKACERLTGLLAESLIGTQDYWRAFYERPRLCLAEVLTLESIMQRREYYSQHKAVPNASGKGLRAEGWFNFPLTGQQHYVIQEAIPIYNESRNLVAIIQTFTDLSDLKRAQKTLQQLTKNDALTGLGNQRAFDEYLNSEWQRAQRQSTEIALIKIDVDQFKRYNEHFGHQEGDACLKRIAEIISQSMGRLSDIACRSGGEEFMLILPATDLEGAKIVADRIHAAVLALAIPQPKVDANACLTVSIGVACTIPVEGEGVTRLMLMMEEAINRAKYLGQNQVVSINS